MNEKDKPHKGILLEQYKLYVEMADRISQRRQSANNYFLSVNILLFSALSYSMNKRFKQTAFLLLIALVGVLVSFIWHRLIRSYKDMNSGKFKVIHEMEKMLGYQPYKIEWEKLGEGKQKNLYLPFTKIELYVPLVFGFSYIIFILTHVFQ